MKVLRDADGQPHRWQTPIGLEVVLVRDERERFHLGARFPDSEKVGWPSILMTASKAFGGAVKPDPGQPVADLEPFVRPALDAVVPHVFNRSIPGFGVNGARPDHPAPALLLAGPFKDHDRCETDDPESEVLILEVQVHPDVPLVVVAAALLRKTTSRRLLGLGDPPNKKWEGFGLAQ